MVLITVSGRNRCFIIRRDADDRFWAEVFLMAQEGIGDVLIWQKMAPKLVPVNLARIQDTPKTISHVTAYNTKVDKMLDVLISIPDTLMHRQSDCFIYWLDLYKGLTWGLNFITSEDATHFLDLVHGRTKGMISRRANSQTSLHSRYEMTADKLRSLGTPVE